jgi:hypothetical protein
MGVSEPRLERDFVVERRRGSAFAGALADTAGFPADIERIGNKPCRLASLL